MKGACPGATIGCQLASRPNRRNRPG